MKLESQLRLEYIKGVLVGIAGCVEKDEIKNTLIDAVETLEFITTEEEKGV